MLQVLSEYTFLPRIRPTAPPQTLKGPGGCAYLHKRVRAKRYKNAQAKYWIFEPANPRPRKAPVIFFFPGWGGIHPGPYRAWIDHMVRRGNIVVYGIYQRPFLELPWRFTSNAVAIIKAAKKTLNRCRPVRAQLEKCAFLGHSAGAVVSANLAAQWEAFGIPKPSALMGVQPGAGMAFKPGIPFADFSKIPSSLLMLMVSGEHDGIVGSNNAIRIYKGASSLPKKNRNFVLMKTDRHGMPWVHSGHFSPVTMGRRRITTIDWFGFWKLFDGLCDAAFTGKNRKYALGNTREQRNMGTWSDGVPVIEMKVVTDPARI